jgi:DNA-binding MurR/RpiR family transcriptional regulator
VVFLGIGSSGHLAHDAALRFAQLNLRAEAYADSYQILNQALHLKKSDVAFGISHSGRSAITVQALEVARQNGALTIGIANYLRSPLHKASDLFLCTAFPESRVKVVALSSRIAQMCLIDALYLLVARRTEISQENTERLNTYIEKVLRLPAR